jgi:hypothetical protein
LVAEPEILWGLLPGRRIDVGPPRRHLPYRRITASANVVTASMTRGPQTSS